MDIISFVAFFVITLQGAFCKCATLAMLGFLCLISCMCQALTADSPKWVRALVNVVPCVFLAILAHEAFRLDELYLGRIAEYRFAGIEACMIILLNLLALLPEGRKKQAEASEITALAETWESAA